MKIFAFLLCSIAVTSCSVFQTDTDWDTHIPSSEAIDTKLGTWNHDGTQIIYQFSISATTPDRPRNHLWVVDLKTKKRRPLFSESVLNADWSPDGQSILFHSPGSPSLFNLDIDLGNVIRLTGDSSPNPDLNYTVAGRWHPTEDKILYSIAAGEPRGVSVMNADGTDARILIPYGINANWSPDGGKIIYVNWDSSEEDDTRRQQIFIANADGTNIQKLTYLENSTNLSMPAISPDGQQVVFVYNRKNEGPEIFLMNIDGSSVRKATEGDGYVDRPEWSPDGQKILFTRSIPNISDRLYFLDRETLEVEPVFPVKCRSCDPRNAN